MLLNRLANYSHTRWISQYKYNIWAFLIGLRFLVHIWSLEYIFGIPCTNPRAIRTTKFRIWRNKISNLDPSNAPMLQINLMNCQLTQKKNYKLNPKKSKKRGSNFAERKNWITNDIVLTQKKKKRITNKIVFNCLGVQSNAIFTCQNIFCSGK